MASQDVPISQLLRSGESADILSELNPLNQISRQLVRQFKVIASEGAFKFDDPALAGISFADYVKSGHEAAGQTFLNLVESVGGAVAEQRERFGGLPTEEADAQTATQMDLYRKQSSEETNFLGEQMAAIAASVAELGDEVGALARAQA